MKRIDTLNARPDLFGIGKYGFSDNVDLPGQDATYLSPSWLNMIQEELANLLELNEIPLNPVDHTQLFNLLATKTKVNELKNDIDVFLYSPIPYASIIPPTGFLMMMGQAISAQIHPKLYALYGGNLPDMRAMFIRGWDNGRGVDSGRVLLSYQADELKSHNHTYGLTRELGSRGTNAFYGDENMNGVDNPWTGAAGGSETRPKNFSYNYIVKAG